MLKFIYNFAFLSTEPDSGFIIIFINLRSLVVIFNIVFLLLIIFLTSTLNYFINAYLCLLVCIHLSYFILLCSHRLCQIFQSFRNNVQSFSNNWHGLKLDYCIFTELSNYKFVNWVCCLIFRYLWYLVMYLACFSS